MGVLGASFLAMVAAWAVPLGGLAAWQLATTGRTEDIRFMAIWVSLFGLLSWVGIVVPMVVTLGDRKWIRDIRCSWATWMVLAIIVYSILLTPIMGTVALRGAWYPAVMGGVAGVVFALLVRKGVTAAPSDIPSQTDP